MSKLRLGPLPSTETTKITIVLSARLRADLERYAALHAETWGQAVDVATLIPHVVAAFIARDRAFRKHSVDASQDDAPGSTAKQRMERSRRGDATP